MTEPLTTDPSNAGKADYEVKTANLALRVIQRVKAKVNHDGSAALAQWAMYWARHKKTTMPTGYAEIRPIPYARNWLSQQLWYNRREVVTDCSGSSDIVAALAGLNVNPAGYPWGSGAGNSGSFFNSAIERFTDVRKIKPGNYVVYGVNGEDHIATIVAVKPVPMVVSHGQPGGPFLQPLSLDTRPRTFLRFNTRAKVVHFPPKR